MTEPFDAGQADVAGIAPPPGGAMPPPSLPCLFINNVTNSDEYQCFRESSCTVQPNVKRTLFKPLLSYDRKCCEMLFLNASCLLESALEQCAFVTITTPQNLSYWTKEGWQDARKRFRSWTCHKSGLPYVFGSDRRWCRVIEPQRRGAIHWHVLIDTGTNIRTGVDFNAFAKGDYRSAGKNLRTMWARMRTSAKAYRLGRCEITPIKADKYEAAARYIGKYISKGIQRELMEHLAEGYNKPSHARRVGFSTGWRVANTRFAWLGDSADSWRRGVARFAQILGIKSYDELKLICGEKWAYYNRDFIQSLGFN